MPRPIDDADIKWLREYEQATLNHFRPRFAAYGVRFADGDLLLARYSDTIENLIAQGRAYFRPVDEAHNEVCVADSILSDPSTVEAALSYEPRLPNTDKTIDFVLREANGTLSLIDVKTIKPQPHDRWDQYERAIGEGWFPANVQFLLQQEWQGGELWHAAFASRSRFMEYTLELEEKLAAASYGDDAPRRILMLCGEGFYWRQDELEDFVAYYRSGVHRGDDPFSRAEARYVEECGLAIQRSVTSFGCLDRRQGDITPRRVNWHVQPPRMPWFSDAV